MTKRIMFALQKGGVGKTTSTVAIAEILAASGYRVLVVDADSQGDTTRMLTGNSIYEYSKRTFMDAIQAGQAAPYVLQVKQGLDLIPADDKLSVLSRYIHTAKINNPYSVFKRLLSPIEKDYDFVFMDVTPALGDALVNAIVYVDHIVIPIDGGDLAMDALLRFIEFVEATKGEGLSKADILGIFITMHDKRSRYEKDVASGIREAFGEAVFTTVIRRKVKIKEMTAIGVNPTDDALEDYFELAEEILKRINERSN